MSSAIREWLNLSVRWFHVFAGIMWVGQTYYFTWLDGQFGKLEKKAAASGTASAVWMVHSGGFYTVEKQKSLGVAPEQVCWFRWEALMTWLGGRVRGIWFGDDGGDGLGIDARVQRPRCVRPRGSDLRHHHDGERLVLHSSHAAQDDRGGGSWREIRSLVGRASEIAVQAQCIYG